MQSKAPAESSNVCMFPPLASPAHEWDTILTILKQSQKITATVVGDNQKTVITLDMQLYEKAVKLQLHKAPEFNNVLFRIGEMHTVMAALCALGDSIEDSGIDKAWLEADI